MADAVEAAAELAYQNLLAARERQTWEVVEHGHRAFIEANKAGVFSIHLYRCVCDGWRGPRPDVRLIVGRLGRTQKA